MGGDYEKTFWDALGGKPAVINIGEEDNAVTEEELHAYSFYRVTDESGELACDGKTSVAFEKRNAMLFAK
jgi:hypothetical protein